jgi:hypothetical protein
MALVKFSQQDERRIKVTKTVPREAACFNCAVGLELWVDDGRRFRV